MSGQTPYRVADFIADFVADIGVKHVFMLPGGGAMHLNDGLAQCARLQAVACLHEQAAAISAETYARINENIGVAMVTTGPGATNAITAVAGAWIESVPLMVISGQVKRADMLRDAPLRQKGVQEVNIVSMVESVTKFAITIEQPEDIRYIMEKAYYLAREGRAGPVWIDVPLDVQAAPIEPSTLRSYKAPSIADEQTLTHHLQTQVKKVIALIKEAKRPLILAGQGIRLSGAANQFKPIVEALGVPVVTTWNAMDLLPYDHDLCVGKPGVVALRAPNFAVQNCDLLISIGSRLDNILTAYNPRGFARAAKKVVVDVDVNEINKLEMDITVAIEADANDFLQTLKAYLNEADLTVPTAWQAQCLAWKQRYPVNDGKPFDTTGAISHYHFADVMSDVIPENTLVTTGSSGLALEIFYTVFRNKPGQRIFLTSGLGAMGYGLPAAVGTCFANACQPMVAVESDGSLQLNIQELATVRAFDLPICLIIMNNAGYCSIRSTQRNYFNGRYIGTGPEAGLMLPDLEKVAQTYNLPFLRINSAEKLAESLQQAMQMPRPCIIDVQLQENEGLMPKASAMPQADGSIISMPLEDMTPLLPLATLKREMIIPLTESSLLAQR
ncbi:MAG: thiamine pyrophosphate-binding protein [Methylophilaceae bacterium]